MSFCLGGYATVSVQLGVYTYEKGNSSKQKQFQFLTKLVKVSDWVKKYVISLMFSCNHCKFLGKLLNQLKLGFKCMALYCISILKYCLIYLWFSCKKSLLNIKLRH